MLHRAILGSLGALDLGDSSSSNIPAACRLVAGARRRWWSPRSPTSANGYAEQVATEAFRAAAGHAVPASDLRNEKISYKVREHIPSCKVPVYPGGRWPRGRGRAPSRCAASAVQRAAGDPNAGGAGRCFVGESLQAGSGAARSDCMRNDRGSAPQQLRIAKCTRQIGC